MSGFGWSDRTVRTISAAGLDADLVRSVITTALAEDLADGPDVTTNATVAADVVAMAAITPRTTGVLAGGPVALAVFDSLVGPTLKILDVAADGSRLIPHQPVIRIVGPVRALLTAERTALNLLTHLSGVATATRDWVDAVAGTGVRIRDTRKTMPGLRALEKYAVRCGGGMNHRMSLGDAALIKDNHVVAAGSVRAAIAAVRAVDSKIALEVEVDTLDQLDEALAAGAELVLLDNFTLTDISEAVHRTRDRYPGVLLEVSGGLSLSNASALARTGIDFLAIGALTHSAPVADLGMDLSPVIAAGASPTGLSAGN